MTLIWLISADKSREIRLYPPRSAFTSILSLVGKTKQGWGLGDCQRGMVWIIL